MWRIIIPLLIPAAAAAQPVTQPSPCEVTISRAPDEVREAIEAWVNAEPRCTTSLDVRVVPTDGGFYLFARDGAGRVRERVVPDAQAAGVLVASWVADDLITPPQPVDPIMPPSATATASVTVVVPGTTTPEPAVVARSVPVVPFGRWLTVGGIWQMHGNGSGGVRAELDLIRRGPWSIGAVLAGSSTNIEVQYSNGYMTAKEARLLGTLARTTTFGKWELRLAAGAGIMVTRATGWVDADNVEGTGLFPTAETSALLSRQIRGPWAFAAGPVAIWYMQTYKFEDDYGSMITMSNRDYEILGFAGIRRRL